MKYLIITTLSLFIVACGGGGGDTASSEVTPVDGTGGGGTTPVTPPPEITGSNDLVIDQTFNLSTQVDVTLNVKNLYLNERAFLNVCLKTAGDTKYSECVYRAPLSNSDISQTITLAHREVNLVAEVWFYDTSREPLSYEWQYNPDLDFQTFTIE